VSNRKGTKEETMSKMKSFAEKISIEMGYGGELTRSVLLEANRILKNCGLERLAFPISQPNNDLDCDDE